MLFCLHFVILFALRFFVCVVLFCLRFVLFCLRCAFLRAFPFFCLAMCSFLFAFSFFVCVGPFGPP